MKMALCFQLNIKLPQSGVLGMHNIVDRPIAVDGEIKIRPIVYLVHHMIIEL